MANFGDREKELLRRIELAGENRKKVVEKNHELLAQLKSRELTHSEYAKELDQVLQGKTAKEWIDYYDDYIKKCKNLLTPEKERIKKDLIRIVPFVLLGLLIFGTLGILYFGFSYEEPILLAPEIDSYLNEKIAFSQTEFFDERSGKVFDIEFAQYGAIVGNPIKWEVAISSSEVSELKALLPRGAFDISIVDVQGSEKVVEEVTEEVKEDEEEIIEEVISEEELAGNGALREKVSEGGDIGVLFSPEVSSAKLVSVPTPGKRAVVEFFMPAIDKTEKVLGEEGKRVSVVNPEGIRYEEVRISSEVDSILESLETKELRIVREKTGEIVSFSIEEVNGKSVAIWFSDIDADSEEDFLIIVITRAEHLDENREFISDIFKSVKELDGIWSETIPSGDFVRVTFEINLDSSRDITIFPRTISGNPRIEVYEVEGKEVIAEFESLNDNQYNKVFLTNLQGEQDTFDLRVVSGSVEFDHIIDPELVVSCQDLGIENEIYELQNDIDFDAFIDGITCFAVSEANITLDGQGRDIIRTDVFDLGDVNGTAFDLQLFGKNFTLKNINITRDGVGGSIIPSVDGRTGVDVDEPLTVINSTLESTINVSQTSQKAGGSVIVYNSTVESIDASGNFCTVACVQGPEIDEQGYVNLFDTNITDYVYTFSRNNGPGGNITFVSDFIYLDNVTIDASGFFDVDLGDFGPGLVSINFTRGFTDIDASYGSTINLNIINRSVGDVLWFNETNTNAVDSSLLSNLSLHVEIAHNFVFVDGAALPGLNKTALVSLYGNPGQGFVNPAVLRDGVECLDCYNFTALTAETVVFNVTGFSNYSIGEETGGGDIIAPGVTINFPQDGENYISDDLPLNFEVLLDEEGSVMYSLDDGVNNVSMQTGDNLIFNDINDSLADDNYVFQVYAVDLAGNTNYTENATFAFRNSNIEVCGTLDFPDVVYTLINDIVTTGTCFTITANNVTLNGNGSSITGDDGNPDRGVIASSVANLTIANITINDFGIGVVFNDVMDSVVFNSTFFSQSVTGVQLSSSSSGNSLSFNNITNTQQRFGIQLLSGSSNNNIADNILIANPTGVSLQSNSNNNVLTNDLIDLGNTGVSITSSAFNEIDSLSISNAQSNAISLSGSSADNNNFTSVTVADSIVNDIIFNAAGIDGTFLINTFLGPYQFADGNIVNFKRLGRGEVRFLEPINGSGLNLSDDIRFERNLVTVESGVNVGLNRSADVTLNNVPQVFSNPVILRNGELCPGNICFNLTALDGLTVIFNVTGWTNYSIGEGVSGPTIVDISDIAPQLIVIGGVSKVNFSVVVSDSDGFGDISNVNASFVSPSLDVVRTDPSCVFVNSLDSLTGNYSCNVDIWYFDEAGQWEVNAVANDSQNQISSSYFENFILAETASFVHSPEGLTWDNLSPGGENFLASESLLLNNTGNADVNLNEIFIRALDLLGQIDDSHLIPAGNFSVRSVELCEGTPLVNNTNVFLPDALLPRGNNSINNGDETSGQELLYVCVEQVPVGLSQQSYSASGVNAWEVDFIAIIASLVNILFVVPIVTARGKKRKKKKKLEGKEKLKELAKSLSGDELLEVLGEKLLEVLSVKEDKLSRGKIDEGESHEIPVSIFKEKISPAESLCKYLKENEGMKFSEIAKLIERDQKTVWTNYSNARKKKKEKIVVDKEKIAIPVSVFRDRRLSVLESVVRHLKEEGFSNKEIAETLERNPKNIWTLYSRVRKKIK